MFYWYYYIDTPCTNSFYCMYSYIVLAATTPDFNAL